MSTLEHEADSIGSDSVLPALSFEQWAAVAGDLQRFTAAGGPPPQAEAIPFRPTVRGSMALLRIVDDGSEDGEVIRIRQERIVIGRGGADVVVPHDISMSAQHAAIERLGESGWQLRDL